jgi:hypothetical protein
VVRTAAWGAGPAGQWVHQPITWRYGDGSLQVHTDGTVERSLDPSDEVGVPGRPRFELDRGAWERVGALADQLRGDPTLLRPIRELGPLQPGQARLEVGDLAVDYDPAAVPEQFLPAHDAVAYIARGEFRDSGSGGRFWNYTRNVSTVSGELFESEGRIYLRGADPLGTVYVVYPTPTLAPEDQHQVAAELREGALPRVVTLQGNVFWTEADRARLAIVAGPAPQAQAGEPGSLRGLRGSLLGEERGEAGAAVTPSTQRTAPAPTPAVTPPAPEPSQGPQPGDVVRTLRGTSLKGILLGKIVSAYQVGIGPRKPVTLVEELTGEHAGHWVVRVEGIEGWALGANLQVRGDRARVQRSSGLYPRVGPTSPDFRLSEGLVVNVGERRTDRRGRTWIHVSRPPRTGPVRSEDLDLGR